MIFTTIAGDSVPRVDLLFVDWFIEEYRNTQPDKGVGWMQKTKKRWKVDNLIKVLLAAGDRAWNIRENSN